MVKIDLEGCSVIVKKNGKFLFVINKKKYWKRVNRELVIPFSNVGGRREINEDILQAVKRECKEETGVLPTFVSSHSTFFIDLNYNVKIKKTRIKPKPFSIYLIKMRGKPNKPYAKGFFIAKVYVFIVKFKNKPFPSSEIPAFMWLDWDMVLQSFRKNMKIEDFLKKGAKIEEREKIPRHAILKPTWTPKVFTRAFGRNFPKLLNKNVL